MGAVASTARNRIRRTDEERRINWVVSIPFFFMHVWPPVMAVIIGWTWADLGLMAARYLVGMFLVTAVYHRYYSHKSYSTSRAAQFILAFLAETSGQKGVIWWGGNHGWHHFHSDMAGDKHTPLKGMWQAHVGWILSDASRDIPERFVGRWLRYPELVWLDRLHVIPTASLALAFWLFGGMHALVWGFGMGTIALYHGTFLINSLAHWEGIGSQRYKNHATDTSRNSLLLALVTLGEGWHNNHHKYPGAARQGIKRSEVDVTYYGLWLLSRIGLIWGLRAHPLAAQAEAKKKAA
jgi:stearoyl-CoA desaturase (delta-9 desaturase)